MFNCPTFYPVW